MSALTTAYAEGRLTLKEHEERIRSAYAARTLGDLAGLVHDLPNSGETGLPDLDDRPFVAAFGRRDRTGRWVVPEVLATSAIGGTVTLDFTDAVFAANPTTVSAVCLGGAVRVLVPRTVRVDVERGRLVGLRRVRGRKTAKEPAYRVLLRVRGVGQVTVRTVRDR